VIFATGRVSHRSFLSITAEAAAAPATGCEGEGDDDDDGDEDGTDDPDSSCVHTRVTSVFADRFTPSHLGG